MNHCVGCQDPTPNTYPHVETNAPTPCCRTCREAAACYAGVLAATVEHSVGVDVDADMLGVLERKYPTLLLRLGFLNDAEAIAAAFAAPVTDREVDELLEPRFTDADFDFQGAFAADLLRRAWKHNPDLVSDVCAPFILGETEDGELAVWLGQPDETTPALATFGAYDEGVEEAIAWLVAHRHDAATTSIQLRPSSAPNGETVLMKSSDPSSDAVHATSTPATAGAKEASGMIALRSALRTYGRHRKWCVKRKKTPAEWTATDACSCGLDDALKVGEYAASSWPDEPPEPIARLLRELEAAVLDAERIKTPAALFALGEARAAVDEAIVAAIVGTTTAGRAPRECNDCRAIVIADATDTHCNCGGLLVAAKSRLHSNSQGEEK
jgi:hypothetical protein